MTSDVELVLDQDSILETLKNFKIEMKLHVKISKVKMFKNSKHIWSYGWFCKYSCNERTADRIRQKIFKYTDIKEVSRVDTPSYILLV